MPGESKAQYPKDDNRKLDTLLARLKDMSHHNPGIETGKGEGIYGGTNTTIRNTEYGLRKKYLPQTL